MLCLWHLPHLIETFFPRETPPKWVRTFQMDTWEHELFSSSQ